MIRSLICCHVSSLELVDNEQARAERFVRGLKDEIRGFV